MIALLRHLLAILVLPFSVTLLIPRWLAARYGVTPVGWQLGDALFWLAGLALFVSTVFLFATRGHGTLAPWDPPQRLVVLGPYRWVRNPMISGVIAILCAEALLFRSPAIGLFALAFFALNAVYLPLSEEPGLARRFGADYARYCANVRRFVPRLAPWRDG